MLADVEFLEYQRRDYLEAAMVAKIAELCEAAVPGTRSPASTSVARVRMLHIKNVATAGSEELAASLNNESAQLARTASASGSPIGRDNLKREECSAWADVARLLPSAREWLSAASAFGLLVISGHDGPAFDGQPAAAADCTPVLAGSGATVVVINTCNGGELAAALHRHTPTTVVVFWEAAVDTRIAQALPKTLLELLSTITSIQEAFAAAVRQLGCCLSGSSPGSTPKNCLGLLMGAERGRAQPGSCCGRTKNLDTRPRSMPQPASAMISAFAPAEIERDMRFVVDVCVCVADRACFDGHVADARRQGKHSMGKQGPIQLQRGDVKVTLHLPAQAFTVTNPVALFSWDGRVCINRQFEVECQLGAELLRHRCNAVIEDAGAGRTILHFDLTVSSSQMDAQPEPVPELPAPEPDQEASLSGGALERLVDGTASGAASATRCVSYMSSQLVQPARGSNGEWVLSDGSRPADWLFDLVGTHFVDAVREYVPLVGGVLKLTRGVYKLFKSRQELHESESLTDFHHRATTAGDMIALSARGQTELTERQRHYMSKLDGAMKKGMEICQKHTPEKRGGVMELLVSPNDEKLLLKSSQTIAEYVSLCWADFLCLSQSLIVTPLRDVGFEEPRPESAEPEPDSTEPEPESTELEPESAEPEPAEPESAEPEPEGVGAIPESRKLYDPLWRRGATGCMLCIAQYSLVTREHHCRRCGRSVCDDCSRWMVPLVHWLSDTEPHGLVDGAATPAGRDVDQRVCCDEQCRPYVHAGA